MLRTGTRNWNAKQSCVQQTASEPLLLTVPSTQFLTCLLYPTYASDDLPLLRHCARGSVNRQNVSLHISQLSTRYTPLFLLCHDFFLSALRLTL